MRHWPTNIAFIIEQVDDVSMKPKKELLVLQQSNFVVPVVFVCWLFHVST
jgi:hypothetical protein